MGRKIVFLASGNGGTLKFIHKAIQRLQVDLNITAVIADRECGACTYARDNNIPCNVVKYSKDQRETLAELLIQYNPDIIVTNIHKIIDNSILKNHPGKFVNLHYSLLPAFNGLIGMKTVDMARESNVQFIGASCHYVNEILDGGKIISQSVFKANWNLPIIETYDIVFRGACLVLLNALLLIDSTSAKNEITDMLILKENNVLFSPGLRLDISVFDEKFFNEINTPST